MVTTQNHPPLPLTDFQLDEDFIRDERPTIAVVVSLWFPDMTDNSAQMLRELTAAGVQAIRDAGGRPVLFDSADPEIQKGGTTWRQEVDGVVFLGGADIHPGFFADVPLSKTLRGVDPAADAFCIEAVQQAVTADTPVLAICRGSQLLNVAMGGTIIQHIDEHRAVLDDRGNIGFLDEHIRIEPESKVESMLGRTEAVVRGAHHQAVEKLGKNLKAVAFAQDGTVEATEHTEKTWVVGLQWHPEEAAANAQDRQEIFNTLVEQARLAMAAPVRVQ